MTGKWVVRIRSRQHRIVRVGNLVGVGATRRETARRRRCGEIGRYAGDGVELLGLVLVKLWDGSQEGLGVGMAHAVE